MQNMAQVEGDGYPSVQDVIDWLSVLESSQAVCNPGGGPFSCLNDFKIVCADSVLTEQKQP